jgi:hypothetical protein
MGLYFHNEAGSLVWLVLTNARLRRLVYFAGYERDIHVQDL